MQDVPEAEELMQYPSWITYAPLTRNWDAIAGISIARMCEVKAIAIHYTEAPGQSARDIRKWFNNEIRGNAPNIDRIHDLTPDQQGNPYIGSHFVVDDAEILALAPATSYTFWHVNDSAYNAANPNYWNQDKMKFPRGKGSFYAIGIEHCHADALGKFSEATLKNSHRLVRWLMSLYGFNIEIGRHYDFSGKCCPLYFSPVIEGKNDGGFVDAGGSDPVRKVKFHPYWSTPVLEKQMKEFRWASLVAYYRQDNPDAIPDAIKEG